MILEDVVELAAQTATAFFMRHEANLEPLMMCLGFRAEGEPVIIALTGNQMPAVAAATRKILIDEGCVQYAFISEIWVSREVAARSGVRPHLAEDREDGLSIIASSRQRSILRTYIIRRMETPPFVELFKHREIDSARPGALSGGGVWSQLLAPEFDATGYAGYFDQDGWHSGHLSEPMRKKGAC